MSETFVLYRMWDDRLRLLYVGRTLNPVGRISEHMRGKEWFDQVTAIHLERHPTLHALIEAEREAIHSEGPAYNLRPERHVPGERPKPNPATAEAKRRRERMTTRSQQLRFDSLRRLGRFGYTKWQLDGCVDLCREVGVSEEDIRWATENMYLDQRRDGQALVERRLADTRANACRDDPPELRD